LKKVRLLFFQPDQAKSFLKHHKFR
jgi:hypothetical protein